MTYSVQINAPKESVWSTLWQDSTFRQWAGIIDPETYMVGDLIEGAQVEFLSAANGYGVTSLVEKVVPNEYLSLLHRADTQDTGANLRDNEWTGGYEHYSLSQTGDTTALTVEFDVPTDLVELFEVSYPKALAKVKELAEHR